MKSRREFIRKGIALTVAASGVPSIGKSLWGGVAGPESKPYVLPPLPYSFEALEPHIDKLTMAIHHGKHHAGYVNKLNMALAELGDTGMDVSSLEKIFDNIDALPVAVRNNAGGHWNHSLFWKVMKPQGGGPPAGEVARMIDASFGSFENLQKTFNEAALDRFGSGWAWLVAEKGKLAVTSTPNQDNPLMEKKTVKSVPVLGLDVWEHAYYLHYQNRRADYVTAWWNLVNWDEVNARLLNK